MKNLTIFLAMSVLMPDTVLGAERCPEEVKVTYPDFAVPPFINGSGLSFAEQPGRVVDWVRQALAQTGCPVKPVFSRRPMKRGFLEVVQNQTDLLIPATPSAEQIKQVVFPTKHGEIDRRLAFTGLEVSLWVRKGERTVHWDGKSLQGPDGFKVDVPAASAGLSMASNPGWNVEVSTNSLTSVEKLLAGRVPVALVADAVIQSLPDDKRGLLEKLKPGIGITYFYSAPSIRFYARYPDFMAKYWQALCEISHADKTVSGQDNLPACP